jgi:hypothetical protein
MGFAVGDRIEFPTPHSDDILIGPWGVLHRGELKDPGYECDNPKCGCHHRPHED